jgi:hypothetical protein
MHGYHKIARPVAKRFPFRLHRRLPNTIGNGRRAWFSSTPLAGIIVMTIPTIVYDDIQQSNCEWEGRNLSACGEAISLPTARAPSKNYWRWTTHLVWFKSVGGKNSYDYSNHSVNRCFLCMHDTGLHYYHYCYYNNNNNSYYYYYLDEVVHNNQPWRVRWSNERRTNDEPLTTNE